MNPLASRMQGIDAFLAMEIKKRADELEATGRDIVHLEIGEPDFPTPPLVLEAAAQALHGERMTYTPALGLPQLREAISRYYQQKLGVAVGPERIIVTAGSSAALLLGLGVLLDPGSEVLLADPSYPCNRHLARTFDAVARAVPVGPDDEYQLDAALCLPHLSERTRAILVASPSNPTGSLASPEKLAGLAALCRERGAALVVDEIYQGLEYDGPSQSALSLGEDIFVVNSFSKFFQMTGFRLGWLVAPLDYVRPLEKLSQNLFIAPSTLAQHAALAALGEETLSLLEERRLELCARRDFLVRELPQLGFALPVRPQGAFYVYADSSALHADSYAFCLELLERAGVALTPGRDFGQHRAASHVRIAYTQKIARLEEARDRMARFLGKS